MANLIKEALEEKVPIKMTPALAQGIIRFVMSYETAGTNMAGFNTPYLGLATCLFKDSDRNGFFELFDKDEATLQKVINDHLETGKTLFGISPSTLNFGIVRYLSKFSKDLLTMGISSSEMRKIVHEIPSIDKNFKVVSDPFNVFTVYIAYKCLSSDLNRNLKFEAAFATLKLLQYKFFTSLVNYRFKYKPNEAIMQTTFEALSDKFDIKRMGTWKALMEARIREFLEQGSIHYGALTTFTDDKEVLYTITDIQSRIRAQINIFVEEYMRVKESEDIIGSYSAIGVDDEGKARLLDNEQGIDMAISSVYQDTMSISRFLDDKAIRLVAGLFTTIRADQLRQVLIAASEKFVKLAKEHKDDLTIEDKEKGPVYHGGHILVMEIIQQAYRYCRNNGVNTKIPTEIIKAAKNMYSSSRIADEKVVAVRVSCEALVLEVQSSRRETTVSALKIAFAIYIVLLSLKYL